MLKVTAQLNEQTMLKCVRSVGCSEDVMIGVCLRSVGINAETAIDLSTNINFFNFKNKAQINQQLSLHQIAFHQNTFKITNTTYYLQETEELNQIENIFKYILQFYRKQQSQFEEIVTNNMSMVLWTQPEQAQVANPKFPLNATKLVIDIFNCEFCDSNVSNYLLQLKEQQISNNF